MDLFQREHQRGVRLFVQRVFIMDDAEELVPIWLRFIKGVIDSDDLPLNVSREILQDSAITRTIRTQVIKKSLDMFRAIKNDGSEVLVVEPSLDEMRSMGPTLMDPTRVLNTVLQTSNAARLTLTEAGALLIEALARSNDQQLAGAIIFLLTASIVTLNFVTDLALAILDPRVRRSVMGR